MAEQEPAPAPGEGDVEITLDGKPHLLKPTLKACLSLSRTAGGIASAVDRCERLDFDMICEVVAQGLGVNPAQKERFVEPAVYREGTINVFGGAILFLRVIANGGRLPDDSEGGEDDDADDPLAQSESQSENSTAD